MPCKIVSLHDPHYLRLEQNQNVGSKLSLIVLFQEGALRKEIESVMRHSLYEIFPHSAEIIGINGRTTVLITRARYESESEIAAISDTVEKCKGFIRPILETQIIWMPDSRKKLLWSLRTLNLVNEALRLV